ncbi:MAG: hypothetical protein IAE82_05530 [Opitutaceae bacterium]|nr:hypothetical protein [Opitutaceae bacterium]
MKRASVAPRALGWFLTVGILILAWHLAYATQEIETAVKRHAHLHQNWTLDLANRFTRPGSSELASMATDQPVSEVDRPRSARYPLHAGPPLAEDRARITKLALESSPEFRELQLKSRRAMIGMRYAPLYAALQLSPDEIDMFEAIALEEQDLAGSTQGDNQTHGRPTTGGSKDRSHQAGLDELERARIELLGQERYQLLQHYDRTLPARNVVHRFAATLVANDVPLTRREADRLTEIMASTSPGLQGNADGEKIDWIAVLSHARGEFSAEQFERLEQFASSFHAAATTARMLTAISEGKEPTPVP